MKNNFLQIAGFLDNSLVNGKGMRSVIFCSGCSHNCKGCHNESIQDYRYGDRISSNDILGRIKNNVPVITGVTFSGGEPFDQAKVLLEIALEIKKIGLNIWSYSGYNYEEILNSNTQDMVELLKQCDVLIDGLYVEQLKDLNSIYKGSSNQRIINVQESLKQGKVILWE